MAAPQRKDEPTAEEVGKALGVLIGTWINHFIIF